MTAIADLLLSILVLIFSFAQRKPSRLYPLRLFFVRSPSIRELNRLCSLSLHASAILLCFFLTLSFNLVLFQYCELTEYFSFVVVFLLIIYYCLFFLCFSVSSPFIAVSQKRESIRRTHRSFCGSILRCQRYRLCSLPVGREQKTLSTAFLCPRPTRPYYK